jgi:CubicO group peptidase (beta-lactamase class C family)
MATIPHAPLFLVAMLPILAADEPAFPKAEPAAVGIDPAALERLKMRAEASSSDEVVVVKDGKLVADWMFAEDPDPIEAMSATKSVVNLAIGKLIDGGKIKGLDQPVVDFYPEWRQGRKKLITIRHLMNHTSGLQNNPNAGELYNCPDSVQFALAAELSDDPGAKFSYNNKAMHLLSGIIRKASGRRMDEYIGEEILAPLGIKDFRWQLDRAGNPYGFAGLQIHALDFARVGQMMLDGGAWRGKRILSEEWVRVSTKPAQPFEPRSGLLWWMIPGSSSFVMDDAFIGELTKYGISEASRKRLEELKGKPMEREQFWKTVSPIIREDAATRAKLDELNQRARAGTLGPKSVLGPTFGFSAEGYLGQFVVVLPSKKIVAVRLRRRPLNYRDDNSLDSFGDFPKLVHDLCP